ncbi:Gp49 family protein [Comamonas sp.]|jgi:Phage protein (N4 Gp49/phage Sf6 gene 66) family|uniref:Gp49 family protein n=1 Tax=Comamonas sp. TaxID=34028 RepID=UPI0028AAB0B7|nr:Gp49 family protein [Comamonas sp.]
MSDNAIEQVIKAKASTAPRVTREDLEAEITHEHYFTAEQGARHPDAVNPRDYANITSSLSRLTFCVLKLKNGFTVTGESACVSPENFDAKIGRDIARANAIEKMWLLLGFRLADQLAAAKQASRA